ncbi:hypothetical protein TNCV_3480251 [Trichonephila clavipes]|nr:hypothetical protein TNCV_3480251 [Trichonephila clavipes]
MADSLAKEVRTLEPVTSSTMVFDAKAVAKQNLYSNPREKNSRCQASAHAENEGVNELLRHCCPFVLQRQSRSSRIVTGGKVRAAKRLPRKSHTCSWDWDPEIVPANPYVQYPHSLRAVRQLLCDDMVHCRP